MKKFFEWMEEHFVPIAAKIGSQRHLMAIRDGFATITPIIMAGAFATLINQMGFQWYQNLMDSILPVGWKAFGGNIWNGSFAIMSLLVVFTVSYHLAKSYDKDGLAAGILALAASIILLRASSLDWAIPFAFLGTQGLFIALIVAIVSTEIFVKLIGNPKLVIKMPAGVPPAVAKSFAALFPSMIVLAIASAVKQIFITFSITDIHQSLFFTIQAPLSGLVGSLPGVLIIIFLTSLLWFFGLHGGNILAPIISAVLLPLTLANTEALNNGTQPQYILNSQFLDSYVNMGGAGTTLALLIAIYIVGKKASAQQRTIANLGIAPGWFNINEPVNFGMPIVLNPMYFFPFILAPMASCIIAYVLTLSGFVPKISIVTGWTAPPIFGAFLATNSVMGAVTAAICLAVSIIIYLPFVYLAAKVEIKNEESVSEGIQA